MTAQVSEKPIFVLGCPRSGTSLVAGLLSRAGAWCGTTRRGRMPDNPHGFFEHIELIRTINKPLLSKLGCDQLGVRTIPALDNIPTDYIVRADVFRVLREDGYDGQRPWLFKDAKLSLVWPLYHHLFPDAQWVVVRRAREDIVQSCLRTRFMKHHSSNPIFWIELINEYEERLTQLAKTAGSVVEIWPQNMLEGNVSAFQLLVERLSLGWRPESISEFVVREFWHDGPQLSKQI